MGLLHILFHLIWTALLISDFRSPAQWPVNVRIALFIYSLHYFISAMTEAIRPSEHSIHNWSHQHTSVSRHQNDTPHCSHSVINKEDRRPKSTVAKTLTIGDKLDHPQKTKPQLFNTAVCKYQCFHDMRQLWMGLCHRGDVTNSFRSWIKFSFRISNFRGTFLVSNIHSSPL